MPLAGKFTNYKSAAVDAAAGSATELVAAVAGKQIWVYGFHGQADAANGTFKLHDAAADKTGTMALIDSYGVTLPISPLEHAPWFKCATASALSVTTVSATIDGVVVYALVEPDTR